MTISRRPLARISAILAAAALLLPALARADGDPASDVLLGQNVYYPYTPTVSSSLQKALDAETAAAKQAGIPVKVALIPTPTDLGVVPDLFGKPQQYAAFLVQEISFQTKQPLLVVMPQGLGSAGLPAAAAAAVKQLPHPASPQSDDLARAAIEAVPKLAAAAGHQLKSVPKAAKASGGSSVAIIVGLALLALGGAAAAFAARSRRSRPVAVKER
jgi:hypothetical protein